MKFFYENKGSAIFMHYGTSLAFDAHLHHHIELVCMMEGRAKAVVDSKECIIQGGDVFLVFPNQIHQYQKIDLENYIVAIFSPDICPEFQNIFKHQVPVSPVLGGALSNPRILPLIHHIMEMNEKKPPYYETIVKGDFLVLLSELFQVTTFDKVKVNDSNTIPSILKYCSANFTKELQLETISEALHISKYHISHLFTQKLKMGFHEYIGMLRTSEACRLLEDDGLSITEISYLVGFNSTRSFNRVFLKYAGTTPKQYRKQLLDGR